MLRSGKMHSSRGRGTSRLTEQLLKISLHSSTRCSTAGGGSLLGVAQPPLLIQGKHCTIVINAVYEAHSDLGVVVGHQDNVKQLLAVRVELPQPVVDVHQGLRKRTQLFGLDQRAEGCISTCKREVATPLLLRCNCASQSTRNHNSYRAGSCIYQSCVNMLL